MLLENLNTKMQFEFLEQNPLIGMACLLDPRYKKFCLSEAAAIDAELNLRTAVEEMYNFEQTNDEDEDPPAESADITSHPSWMHHHIKILIDQEVSDTDVASLAMDEVDRYFKEHPLPISKDPLAWWDRNQHTYKNLYKLAKKV